MTAGGLHDAYTERPSWRIAVKLKDSTNCEEFHSSSITNHRTASAGDVRQSVSPSPTVSESNSVAL
ncbi:hypothetical protein PCASD_21093, partial [Puccinia coronata f. sp. avenae]